MTLSPERIAEWRALCAEAYEWSRQPDFAEKLSILDLANWANCRSPTIFILKRAFPACLDEIERMAGEIERLASKNEQLRHALAALVLNIDAGGATLGAMKDAREALTLKDHPHDR